MTINEFTKFMGLPEMKLLGNMNGYTWYIIKNPLKGMVGVPTIIRERNSSNIFEILDSNEALSALRLFNKEE